ncbi:hypothetical protein GCM10011501_16260 [Thalassotalea profundi]|uniref:Uncharacterized protein n=1 Tax=Thalassotalea profundi TaxID=2036687 RepID=A0ABQ3IL00_9GAMM|nr:hypothetical protein GCM10011501_16260 [Thalassotalea profundi]
MDIMNPNMIVLILGQLISTFVIVYTNKTEITWIKAVQEKHDLRITSVEKATHCRRKADH